MIICICHNVSDKTICALIKEHKIEHLKELKRHVTVCQQCGKCKEEIKQMIKNTPSTN